MKVLKPFLEQILTDKQIFALRQVKRYFRPSEREIAVAVKMMRALGRGVSIDVGANLADYTSALAKCSEKVIAFEANPEICRYLARVLPATVIVENLALSDQPGELVLRIPVIDGRTNPALATVSTSNPFADERPGSFIEIEVTATTLDTYLMENHPNEDIKFIKIDVEGHEKKVLDGGLKTIQARRPVLLIEIERRHGADVAAIFDLLNEQGYCSYILEEKGGMVRKVAFDELETLQSSSRLQRKLADPHYSGYVNNFFFVPESQSGSIWSKMDS